MWGEGTRYEFLRGPHVSPLRAGPPQEKKRLPGAEGPPEGRKHVLIRSGRSHPPTAGARSFSYYAVEGQVVITRRS